MRGRYLKRRWRYDPYVYAPAKHRRACAYEAFLPDPVGDFNEPLPADLAGVISDAEAAARSLNDRARPALQALARLLLRTESIASSKVEGLQVDARALARAEADANAGRRPGPVVEEVLANIDAMELAVEQARVATELTPSHLTEIHATLMRHAPNARIAGRIRTEQNWIGGNDYNPCGAAFVPPPPEEVPRLLDDLCELCNSEHLPPVIHAAIAHAQFETIHPFTDGNGRTGRALIHVLLRRRGLTPTYVPPVSVVLAAGRDRYIRGLEEFRQGAVESWIERFAVATRQSASTAERYIVQVAELQESWRTRLRAVTSLRSDAAAWAVIDGLPGHPVITVAAATAMTGRSKSSIAVAIDQLAAAGILLPLSSGRRNRAWEASGLLDLLANLESDI